MKKFILFLLFIFAYTHSAFSQLKHDNIWTMGYGKIGDNQSGYPFGGVIMDFSTSPPTFNLLDYPFFTPLAAISDKEGQLVAYTNGCRILNRHHEGMLNGDTLNPGKVYEEFCTVGHFSSYPLWQPCIFLPKPGSDSLYYLFHLRDDDYLWNPMNLMYSIVDASAAGGDGVVISKNTSVLSDSIFLAGYVTATRHANGRDWWVVVPRRFSHNKHVSLLTAEGVTYQGMQDFDGLNIPIDTPYCCSQTAFSADGSKYFHNSPNSLFILDFDRCTGTMSNPIRLDWAAQSSRGFGVATSPNSRFLYHSNGNYVEQYDLWATDLLASKQVVAAYDGFMAPNQTGFFQMMPGPDGKIYIVTTATNNILHVIHNPNAAGLACTVEQHALTLPARQSYLINNFANYNLGPIDGASCDTLGINNLPIARFKWNRADSLSPQHIAFTDYSYHTPTTWHWDFGNGSSGQDTSPVHVYSAAGVYSVCLTVCNDYACDTTCQEVKIKTVATNTLEGPRKKVNLSPNPAHSYITVKGPWTGKGNLSLVDLQGRILLKKAFSGAEFVMELDFNLPSGLYWVKIQTDDGEAYIEKLFILGN